MNELDNQKAPRSVHSESTGAPALELGSLSAPLRVVPLAGNEHLAVSEIVVLPSDEPPSELDIVHLETRYYDSAGRELPGSGVTSIAVRKDPDVVDVFPYYVDEAGEVWTFDAKRQRPAIAARAALGVRSATSDTGLLYNSPGGYICQDNGEFSPTDAGRVIVRKAGLEAANGLNYLGPAYIPSVDSTEMVLPRAIRVEPPAHRDEPQLIIGSTFDRSRVTRWQTVEERIQGFLTGEHSDLRTLVGNFRLAELHQKRIALPESKTPELLEISDLSSLPYPVLSFDEVVSRERAKLHPLDHLEIRELDSCQNPKRCVRRFVAESRNSSGEVLAHYPFDVIAAEKIDAVGSLACFRHQGKVFVAVNEGGRPSLEYRNTIRHPIHTETTAISREGYFLAIPRGQEHLQGPELAKQALREKTHLLPAGEPVFVGQGTPTPGFDPARWYLYLTPIGPGRAEPRSPPSAPTSHFFVELNDALRLVNSGEIRALGLIAQLHLLKAAVRYPDDPATELASPEEIQKLQELMNSPSPLHRGLFQLEPDFYRKVNHSALGRKVLTFLENEAGAVLHYFQHPDEHGFFNALNPVFALSSIEDPRQMFALVFHDAFHFPTGEVIPYELTADGQLARNPDGSYRVWSFDQYRIAIERNESLALWYSEVIFPRIVGVEEFERMIGCKSVASMLEAAGIRGDKAEEAAIRSMVIDGVIPPEIVRHPEYEQFRPIIRRLLLGYHVRDGVNTRLLYENWIRHPKAAEVATRFCDVAFTDLAAYEANLTSVFERILRSSDGANPLKAKLASTGGFDIRQTAFKLAYLWHRVEESGVFGCEEELRSISDHLSRLGELFDETRKHSSAVRNVDINATNVAAFRTLTEGTERVLEPARAFASSLERDPRFFNDDEIASGAGKIYPFFKRLEFEVAEYLTAALDELEARSFDLAGLMPPKS